MGVEKLRFLPQHPDNLTFSGRTNSEGAKREAPCKGRVYGCMLEGRSSRQPLGVIKCLRVYRVWTKLKLSQACDVGGRGIRECGAEEVREG